MNVTAHAKRRYIERINPAATFVQAEAAIRASENAVRAAAKFGCRIVLLGNGGRLVLDGENVITVLAPGWKVTAHGREAVQ